MGNAVFKQPNGLYGRYSYVSDNFTNYNMTKEEYIVSCAVANAISREEWDFNHNQNFTDYKQVKKDALDYVKFFDEWIKDAEDDEEKNKLKEDKEKELTVRTELISIMEKNSPSSYEDEYWKQLYELLNRLALFYDEEGYRKDYIIVQHEEDMRIITQRLKEINETFDAYKNLTQKSVRNEE